MDRKKIINKILFPPGWLIAVLAVLSGVGLTYVFLNDLGETLLAIPVYVISFYTLSTACLFFAMVLPKRYKRIKQKVLAHPLGSRYMNDVEFKNEISLFCSLGINLLYVATNAVSAIINHTFWFGILAGYYLILALMRFLLVRYMHKNPLDRDRVTQLQYARICAVILTTLNLVLSGAVLMILYQNRGFEYMGILIYVMAAYTFYMTTMAIIDLVKYRKYNNPILSTAKVIKLASALVSMLSLETAMFAQFGADMTQSARRLMIALTGAGISVTVITMAVVLIVSTTREIRKIRSKHP